MWRGRNIAFPKRILITGIPGTRLSEAIKKVPLPPGMQAHSYKIEDLLCAALNEDDIMMALCQPKFVLRRALRQVVTDLATKLDQQPENSVTFILAHGVYYLGNRQEFVYLLQESLLRLLRLEAVVTLIDDVYDVLSHLSLRGEIFGRVDEISVVNNLIHLLSWRQQEFSFCQHLACEIDNLPHLLLATKHPVKTLHKWLFTNQPCVYLSHPITDLRHGIDQEYPQAVASANRINQLSAVLSEKAGCVLLAPTTIDELRFAKVPDSHAADGGLMMKRWPLLAAPEELLYVPPSQPRHLDHFYRLALMRKSTVLIERLDFLKEAIHRQISGRDRILVDQSDGLFLWRPYYSGRMSTGMYEELKHLKTSQQHDAGTHRFVSVHVWPHEEWANYLALELVAKFNARHIQATDVARFLASPSNAPLWRTYSADPRQLPELDCILVERGFDFMPSEGGGPLTPDLEVKRRSIWREIVEHHVELRKTATGGYPEYQNDINGLLAELQRYSGVVVRNTREEPSEDDAVGDLKKALSQLD